jgi:hypothetical protein
MIGGEIIRPGASEAGFWRVKPNNVLEVVMSHNTGISEGWVGQFDGPKIQLVLDQGYSAPSAKVVDSWRAFIRSCRRTVV